MCAYNMKIFTICHLNTFISFSVMEQCGWLRKVPCCYCHVFLLSSVPLFFLYSSYFLLFPFLLPSFPSCPSLSHSHLLTSFPSLPSPPSIPILLPCPPCLPLFMPLSTFIHFQRKITGQNLPALVKEGFCPAVSYRFPELFGV